MWRSLLSLPLCIVGCATQPAPAATGVSVNRAQSLPFSYQLTFSVTKKDPSLESWAQTTYTGQLRLTVERHKHARLNFDFDTRNTGGDFDGHTYEKKDHGNCELQGRARWEGDVLRLAFRYPKVRAAPPLPFECGSRRLTAAVPGFELRCATAPLEVTDGPERAQTRRVQVLNCELDEDMPVLLSFMSAPWQPSAVIALSDTSLHVEIEDDLVSETIHKDWCTSSSQTCP